MSECNHEWIGFEHGSYAILNYEVMMCKKCGILRVDPNQKIDKRNIIGMRIGR